MTETYSVDRRNKVRVGNRADYDRTTVQAILDAALIAHVGFVVDGRPVVIPMIHGRDGETVYVHGAKATRLIKQLAKGVPACLEVTLADGIVVGRSAFHSSMNYRSVVVHGTARKVEDADEHARALEIVTEHILPGRWAEVRPMLDKEVKATGVIAIEIEAASAKVRAGEPIDEESDYDTPVWGGVVPLRTTYGAPEGDSRLLPGVEVPASVAALTGKAG
ncbi:pyridoxamine 5'-phosphate oxidase family protein [Rhodobium gokarnense]|uniref:Nitroimidazol reductase NimA-like FMN-containing flavoprotein (Pyridoxamine 5'-phosphate oxidase superfamily) n=1 Tax=Rhodobium gokarnense TaxID=364296 RepID=A0ABT3H9H5_9HYPH|nr:pyridoxamine 5'-phosphate oxidase family protein [Rhodobium gokarnense]MCW2307050.1 nitroimidazol reductase NimA-like FMN-containing flavoprotein (pyridoxamine 5'-phosphate oxidase superfamily) [Rhodobium gokarnense]